MCYLTGWWLSILLSKRDAIKVDYSLRFGLWLNEDDCCRTGNGLTCSFFSFSEGMSFGHPNAPSAKLFISVIYKVLYLG